MSTIKKWHFSRNQTTFKHVLALNPLAIKRLCESETRQHIKADDWSSVLTDKDKEDEIWDKNLGSEQESDWCMSLALVKCEQYGDSGWSSVWAGPDVLELLWNYWCVDQL